MLKVVEKSFDVVVAVDVDNFRRVVKVPVVARDAVVTDVEDVGNDEQQEDVERHEER